MIKFYTWSYDPELDLWAVICPDGYVVEWVVFKWQAVKKAKGMNKVIA